MKRRFHPIHLKEHGTISSYNLGCRCSNCARLGKSYWAKFFEDPSKADRRKDYWYKSQYGMTLADADKILETQGGLCKICLLPLAPKFGGKGNRNHVDHVHGSKVVRGILDEKCNKGIGYFHDDPVLLERAAHYVRTAGRFDDWAPGIGAGLT